MRKLIEGITDSMIDSEGEAHMIKRIRGVPHEGEEPSTRSPSVTSMSLTALDAASMDITLEDIVLPIQANKAIKVPANIIENTAVTCQYVTVKRKGRRKIWLIQIHARPRRFINFVSPPLLLSFSKS